MFYANRWADVFVAVLGENVAEGLACLKAMASPLKAVSGSLFGYSVARRLEALLRECADTLPIPAEYPIRFITLLVEKNQWRHIEVILQKIEERIDIQRGALTVIAETTVPLDGAFEAELKENIIKRLGAADVNIKTRLVPELLGGYRLRIGGFFVDASLKGQSEGMTAALEAAV
jgi:F-type H+-transporting ATPase subunit delta